MFKKGEKVYVVDVDKDGISEGYFEETYREFLKRSVAKWSENIPSKLVDIYVINLIDEGAILLNKNSVFNNYYDANNKLNAIKEKYKEKLLTEDGLVNDLINIPYSSISEYDKNYALNLLGNNKELFIEEFLLPWFDSYYENNTITSIMSEVLKERYNINIDDYI